ncbi:MAG: Rieske 2Fe-2S domain-containing protein [Asticcacaulis sp.]|uniref:Rieske 2Fe-2S domain-containing protein n=1 Tax=Asticcacaulis sp. TaxID=1872648 RepID=UPI003F7B93E1
MFNDFANLWTPLCQSQDIRAGAAYPFVVAGQRVVVFRDESGKASALIDRCPHRGVALSLGKVRDGVIECPFHGWRFHGDGRNCYVPWNLDARRDKLGALALPAAEAGGLVWLYTGFSPSQDPEAGETLLRRDLRVTGQHMIWNVHWTRVMENMLDTPHLPFVHQRTIGRALKHQLGRDMTMVWTPESYGGRIYSQIDGEPRGAGLIYRFPNIMELIIDPPGKCLRLMAVCTPEAAGKTRLSIYTLRSFARLPVLDPVFRRLNTRIALEDKAIVESSLPSEAPPAHEERSVRTDRPTLAFRKIWFDRLKGSSAPLSAAAVLDD